MAEFPKQEIWTDALIGDTTHLSAAEFGAYVLMLIAAWRSPDCSLPNDDQVLGRITRDPRHWPRIKAKVMAFWTLGDDNRWRQKRLTKEREYAAKTRKQRSEAGHLGAEKRRLAAGGGASLENLQGTDLAPTDGTDSAPRKSSNTLKSPETGSANGLAPNPYPLPSEVSKQDPPDALFESVPSPTKGNGHAKRKDAGTRLSRDWQPNPDDIAYAEQRGLDAGAVAEAFRDWWIAQPGAKGCKLDWHATWRTWCRREAEKRGAADQRSRAGQGPVGETAAILRVLDHRKN
jgi:uncharacterized protein YdaU (DUF1376 family)